MAVHDGAATFAGSGALEVLPDIGILVPDADISAGTWINELGGTPLYPSVDETIIDDRDLIRSTAAGNVVELGLSDPFVAPDQPFSVAYRYKKTGSPNVDLNVSLMEGATAIKTWSHSNISESYTTVEQVLSGAEFLSIGNFNNLSIKFTHVGVGGYVGPGDVVSGATAWWGLRAYTAASIGSNVVKIRRSSDNTTKIFVSQANGGIDQTDAFLDGSNYFVDTLYDQTGGGVDVIQTTAANQLRFYLNAMQALPAVGNAASLISSMVSSASIAATVQPFMISQVVSSFTNANQTVLFRDTTGVIYNGYHRAAADHFLYAGTSIPVVSLTDNVPHRIQDTYDNNSSESYIDGSGTAIALNNTTGIASSTVTMFDTVGGGQSFVGAFFEMGIWPGAWTGTQKTNMDTNQLNYWFGSYDQDALGWQNKVVVV